MNKLYVFDKKELIFKSLNYKSYFKAIAIMFFIFSTFGFTSANYINSELEKIPVIIRMDKEKFTPENFKLKLKQLNLKHQDIIYAQAILETNNFTSNIFKNNNNLFGMKCAKQRPTIHIGENLGHAQYRTWEDCLIDYALWQTSYAKGLNENEYFTLLDKMYAENSEYVAKLKNIIKHYE